MRYNEMMLETSRLVLPELGERHLQRFLAVAGARAIADTTISIPHPLSESAAREWIGKAVAESQENRALHFAITIRPQQDVLVGCVALKAIDLEHREAELSFWLDGHHAGRGYITEAAAAVIEHALSDLHLNRLCAYHMVRNPASGRVLEKLHFRPEGLLRQRVRKWGVYEDVRLWARLASDSVDQIQSLP